MLVLHRKPAAGDKSVLCISDPRQGEIVVTVLAIRGELVELAVSAPADVAVEKKSPVVNTRPNTRPHPAKSRPLSGHGK